MSIELKDVSEEIIPFLTEKLPCMQTGDCNLSIFSIVGRSEQYKIKYAIINNSLVLYFQPYKEAPEAWVLPKECCQNFDLIKEIETYSKELNRPVVIYGRFTEITASAEHWLPYRNFLTISSNSWWDYLYEREKFVKLEGRKLHGKRNFIKRFWTAHSNAQFLPINNENIQQCREFLAKWYEDYGEITEDLRFEGQAIEKCFNHWDKFQVTGGMLIDDGKVLGFTFGSMVSEDIFAVHIEKADRTVTGAYPALAQQLAMALPENVAYLNREEDLGIAGLRKAKQDWYPTGVVRKTYLKLEKEMEFGSK